MNLGIDFKLFNNRFSGSIDAYRKFSKNLIFATDVDPTTGIGSVFKNSASMVGKGIDLTLSSVNIDKAVNWRTELLVSRIANEVKDYLRNEKI